MALKYKPLCSLGVIACATCQHLFPDDDRGTTSFCDAFPDGKGIPEAIVIDGDPHTKPLPEQKNDIVYKKGRR